MNQESVRQYLERQRERYRNAGKKEKGKILDEIEEVTGYHRKAAIRALSDRRREANGGRVGRPVEYGPEVAAAVQVVHEAAGGIGARRLHPFVGELASRLAEFSELELDASTEAKLGRASAATLERLLAAHQVPVRKRVTSLTKAGTLLRNRIPVRTCWEWDDAGACGCGDTQDAGEVACASAWTGLGQRL